MLQTVQWKCLGAWTGEDGQQYLSLLDTKLAQLDEAPHPRYRCAIYKHEPALGGYLQQYLQCINTIYYRRDLAGSEQRQHVSPRAGVA